MSVGGGVGGGLNVCVPVLLSLQIGVSPETLAAARTNQLATSRNGQQTDQPATIVSRSPKMGYLGHVTRAIVSLRNRNDG